MADPELAKKITKNIEDAYQSLRKAATSLTGLLAVGRATCEEVKTYNLYALSVYSTQKAMLVKLRAAGEKNVPDQPAFPTLFTWKGVTGQEAWKINCPSAGVNGLGGVPFGYYHLGDPALYGALAAAMISAEKPNSVYLDPNQIKVITSDSEILISDKTIPRLADITNAADGLGTPIPLIAWLVIAAFTIGVTSYGLYALSEYWKEQAIQEETTERTKVQAEAFAVYAATRMSCYDSCISRGETPESCVSICTKLVDKPNLKIDSARGSGSGMGSFGTIGLIAVAGIGAVVLFKLHKDSAS